MKLKILILLFIPFLYINAQTRLDNAIKNLETNYTQEKVYILFNKNEFTAGENIWLKAFVFKNYFLTDLSTTLFVELYDNKKNLIDKKRVLLINGQGDSSFKLKEDLQDNIYYIRAYTTYMTNFSEDYQYIKQIPIYATNSTKQFELNKQAKWNAALFPEANTFLENQTTKFAVRLTSNGLNPDKWSGYVIDKNNPTKKLAEFKSYDQNVADFYFKADSDKNYELIVLDENENKQIIEFPKPHKNGIKLEASVLENEVKYRLKAIGNSNSLKNYKIVGTINNQLVYKAEVKKSIKQLSNGISLNENLYGILQLSIFNENDQHISSRLIFIRPNNFSTKPQLSFDINQNKRASNSIQITNPVSDNYTALVNQEYSNHNLLSTLWLTEDLKTPLQNPAQYFSKNANPKALDAILISEKWKKFNWNNLNSGQYPTIKNKPEPYLSYKGKVIKDGTPLINSTLNFFINLPNSDKKLEVIDTNNEGNFYLKNIISPGDFSINYFENTPEKKTKNSVPLNISLVQLNNFESLKKDLPQSDYILSEKAGNEKRISSIREQLETNKKIESNKIRLKEVLIRAEKEDKTQKLNDELSSTIFKRFNEIVFDFVNNDYQTDSYKNMADWLSGRAAGVIVYKDSILIRDVKAKFFLDEIEIELESFKYISPINVAMLKIYKEDIITGSSIAIYTKRGNHNPYISPNSRNVMKIEGYSKSEDFLSIDDYEKIYKKVPSDTRDVLYWNPNIMTAKQNEEIIEYYNNDMPQDYYLTVIGFDKNGFPIFYDEKIN